jgi:hypothetical protein
MARTASLPVNSTGLAVGGGGSLRRILVPVDASSRSACALALAARDLVRKVRSSGGRACIPVTSWTGGGPGTVGR